MLNSGDVRLMTLTENTTSWLWLLGESGWSIMVEADGQRLPFDTGLTTTAVWNAQRMGISPVSFDRILLSHGHNDHSGGLRSVLQAAGVEVGQTNYVDPPRTSMEVVCHPEIWGPSTSATRITASTTSAACPSGVRISSSTAARGSPRAASPSM